MQSRSVSCTSSTGEVEPDSLCPAGMQPPTTRACGEQECSMLAITATVQGTECSSSCGESALSHCRCTSTPSCTVGPFFPA
jgi:hypothetical protein